MSNVYKTLLKAKTLLLFTLFICENLVVGHARAAVLSHHTFIDTTVCGSSVTLTATAGLSNYKWNTGATTQTITASSSGTYWWEYTDYSSNKVVNGNFSSGFTGFTSSYIVPGER